MPRRSPNDIPPISEIDRPKPPAGMAEDAAAIWNAIVGCMRPQWIAGEALDLLARYCFAQSQAAKLEGELIATPLTDPMRPRLVKMYQEMCATALSYGRALRLSPKDNLRSKVDGRGDLRGFEPPWEFGRQRKEKPMPRPWEG
jgi:hypothetical protein